jgi:hypothetical protein
MSTVVERVTTGVEPFDWAQEGPGKKPISRDQIARMEQQ